MYNSADVTWTLVAAFMVFFMQAGFALCEAGLTRAKNPSYSHEVDATLLPKVKVEVVVSKIPVDTIIDAATKALYTGHIGDGKIFVYNVAKVVKVRTGEQDYAALQDVE